jgi:hypothetical protein
MRLQDLIEELIRLIDLIHLSRPCNDDLAGREWANRNAFALAITISQTLPRAGQFALTDSRPQRIPFLVIIILGIHTLINCALMGTEQVIDIAQNLV